MALSTRQGFNSLLKEGHKHFGGLEEAILKNIQACKDISNMTKTSLGPNGMKKMVINHLDKIFVTSDAATIMSELEVAHPAAKMVVMASKMQETECGDMTNFVITFAGELLNQAESLIKMGLHPSQVIYGEQKILDGYQKATAKAIEFLEQSSMYSVEDFRNHQQVQTVLQTTLTPKLMAYAPFFANLLAQLCIQALPQNPSSFNVEHIRVCKLLGSNVYESFVLQGMVVARQPEGSIKSVLKPKVAVYGCPLDTQQSDTKGTVLLKSAKELMNYTKSEEEHAEKIIRSIADAGVNLVVVGGSISDICLHYAEKFKLMIVKVQSKFELRRLCRCLNATALARLGAPTAEEIGVADEVYQTEIGSQKCTIFKRESQDCKLATLILRGSTNNLLDDIERAVDDAVNTYKSLLKDQRFLPGAGAIESQLGFKLETEAGLLTGLEQYSFAKYAQSFECFSRILIENSGLNVNDVLGKLKSANTKEPSGIDINNGKIVESSKLGVWDHLQSKIWAVRLASDAAITILRIDQIIISKPSGGPKPKENKNWDEDN